MANIVEVVVFPPMLRRDSPPGNRSYHEFESIISSSRPQVWTSSQAQSLPPQ